MTKDPFTISETFLKVGQEVDHRLCIEEWGNPQAAQTFVHLHGGPGSGTGSEAKDNYDPSSQHVIFYDQRGAGKSTPSEEIHENTTDDLVNDLLLILNHFSLEKVTLVGRSWGSTLALIFAELFPERVENLVIGGIFLADNFSIGLLAGGAYRLCYPDVWEAYENSVPSSFHDDPSAYYLSKVKQIEQQSTDDPDLAKFVAPYDRTERSVAHLASQIIDLKEVLAPDELHGANLEIYYAANSFFIPEGEILDHVTRLNMPIYIIQGRYDMVCPPAVAWKLVQALTAINRPPILHWTIAGHSGSDPKNLEKTRQIIADISKN